MQDDTAPRCVWVVSEATEEEARCHRAAKYMYHREVREQGKLPTREHYPMCGKHASPKNRKVAEDMGYEVEMIA